MIHNRGALIVLEGCDKAGKSTQCRKLKEALNKKNILTETMSFPDRSTPTGKLINEYLSKKTELSDRTIHLLFSANRWELANKIERMLNDGITLIVDRYAYSGVVYSTVKQSMNLNWCKQPDTELPKPDLVYLLTISSDTRAQRSGYGKERYETNEYQQKVAKLYMELKDDYWKIVDADDSIDNIHQSLLNDVLEVIKEVKNKPLEKLW